MNTQHTLETFKVSKEQKAKLTSCFLENHNNVVKTKTNLPGKSPQTLRSTNTQRHCEYPQLKWHYRETLIDVINWPMCFINAPKHLSMTTLQVTSLMWCLGSHNIASSCPSSCFIASVSYQSSGGGAAGSTSNGCQAKINQNILAIDEKTWKI